jgi:hypothetical protein
MPENIALKSPKRKFLEIDKSQFREIEFCRNSKMENREKLPSRKYLFAEVVTTDVSFFVRPSFPSPEVILGILYWDVAVLRPHNEATKSICLVAQIVEERT